MYESAFFPIPAKSKLSTYCEAHLEFPIYFLPKLLHEDMEAAVCSIIHIMLHKFSSPLSFSKAKFALRFVKYF